MNKAFFKILLVLFVFTAFIWSGVNQACGQQSDEERLYIGEAKIIPVNNPTRIAIGNPKIADVASVSRTEMVINPKSTGSTSLTFWDNFGEQSLVLRVYPEDMQDVKRRIDSLLANLSLLEVHTQAQDEEGKVMLLGEVKTAQDRERVLSVLGPLKDKVVDLLKVKEEESAVEIDVQLLELNKDSTNTLGLSWPGSITLTEVGSAALTGAGWSDLFKISSLSRAAFTLKLDALIQEGKARVLSRPRLLCQSGKEAELLVGGEKPILTTTVAATTGATGTEVEYKEFGIKLNIKPIVTDDQRVKLSLKVEVSEFSDTAITLGESTAPTALAYPLTKRNAATELFLNDNQTMSIGGLIKHKTEEDLRKVPWFADVPILGLFFRQRVTKTGGGQGTRGDTELFIILTPKIVSEKKNATDKTKTETASIVSLSNALTDNPSFVDKYASIVQKRISDNLTYPASARSAGFQGTTKLKLLLSYQGQLLDVVVQQSSGYAALDDAAVSAARKISLYPPFPTDIYTEEAWIDVPVIYRLN